MKEEFWKWHNEICTYYDFKLKMKYDLDGKKKQMYLNLIGWNKTNVYLLKEIWLDEIKQIYLHFVHL